MVKRADPCCGNGKPSNQQPAIVSGDFPASMPTGADRLDGLPDARSGRLVLCRGRAGVFVPSRPALGGGIGRSCGHPPVVRATRSLKRPSCVDHDRWQLGERPRTMVLRSGSSPCSINSRVPAATGSCPLRPRDRPDARTPRVLARPLPPRRRRRRAWRAPACAAPGLLR